MTRSVVLSLCAVALVALSVGASQAQTNVTLSLDLLYTNPGVGNSPDANEAGSWQLYALTDSVGVAAVDVSISGIVGSPSNVFRAPEPAFKLDFNSGTTPYDVDQDGNSSTLDMVFVQKPVAVPGPQDLQYGVGVAGGTTPNTDELGASVDTSGSSMTDAVLLASGTFSAGSAPTINMFGNLSGANVFTLAGTSTLPGVIGSAAPFTYQIRDNLSTLKGDIDLDGTLVDGGDAGILFGNWDDGIGTNWIWQDGDLNGDKQLDGADAGMLFGSWTGDPGPTSPGTAIAEYDPATGQIIVSVNDVNNWYVESSAGGVMTGDAPANIPQGGGALSDSDIRVGETGFISLFGYEDVDLGNVAQTGLLDDGSLRVYWNTGLGTALQSVAVTFVPEPTTLALAGLALCGVMATRRCRVG